MIMSPTEMSEDGWMPTLLDIEKWKDEDPERFGGYGWSALEVPGDCPRLALRMSSLERLFFERYARRMISAETLEAWQLRLQNRLDCEAHVFERAYSLYEKYAGAMDDVIEGEDYTHKGRVADSGSDRMTTDSKNTSGGTDTVDNTGTQKTVGSSTGKTAETPDTAINLSDSYADSVQHTEGDSTRTDALKATTAYGRTDAAEGTQLNEYGKTTDTDDSTERRIAGFTAERVMQSIGAWRDLDCDLIGRFENLFMNVFWY